MEIESAKKVQAVQGKLDSVEKECLKKIEESNRKHSEITNYYIKTETENKKEIEFLKEKLILKNEFDNPLSLILTKPKINDNQQEIKDQIEKAKSIIEEKFKFFKLFIYNY